MSGLIGLVVDDDIEKDVAPREGVYTNLEETWEEGCIGR